MGAWKEESFRVTLGNAIELKRGWTYNGLGIIDRSAPFNPEWAVIHLNSGHAVARLRATGVNLERMQEIAGEIADAGDWSFDGIDGYKNMFPDAAEKIGEIMNKHFPNVQRKSDVAPPNPVNAKAIALLREDEEARERAKDLERGQKD